MPLFKKVKRANFHEWMHIRLVEWRSNFTSSDAVLTTKRGKMPPPPSPVRRTPFGAVIARGEEGMVKPEGEDAEMKGGGGESGVGLLMRVKEKENEAGAPEGIVKATVPLQPSNCDAFRKMGGFTSRISTWPEGEAKAMSPPIVIWELTVSGRGLSVLLLSDKQRKFGGVCFLRVEN